MSAGGIGGASDAGTAPSVLGAEAIGHALDAAGVESGDTLVVHVSLRRLGYVAGGAEAFVRAALDAVGDRGTLMAPVQTWLNLDPSSGVHGVPEAVWPALRAALPGFDPATTPSVGMGAVAETVRVWPGARRSDHPVRSWAAVGARAEAVVAVHDLHDVHGEASPLGAAERADAKVVLAGVGFDKCTALHLAETRAVWPGKRVEEDVSWVRVGDGRREVRARSVAFRDDDFVRLGAAFEAAGEVTRAALGDSELAAFRVRELVDFAVPWMEGNRSDGASD